VRSITFRVLFCFSHRFPQSDTLVGGLLGRLEGHFAGTLAGEVPTI